MSDDALRMCRIGGRQPTTRERWASFYRLWRIVKNNVSGQVCEQASSCFRVLMYDWRWLQLVEHPGDYYESLRFMPVAVRRWRVALESDLLKAVMRNDCPARHPAAELPAAAAAHPPHGPGRRAHHPAVAGPRGRCPLSQLRNHPPEAAPRTGPGDVQGRGAGDYPAVVLRPVLPGSAHGGRAVMTLTAPNRLLALLSLELDYRPPDAWERRHFPAARMALVLYTPRGRWTLPLTRTRDYAGRN